jgi:hypothetical protein
MFFIFMTKNNKTNKINKEGRHSMNNLNKGLMARSPVGHQTGLGTRAILDVIFKTKKPI